jgi:membrane protease YdiL (CAAX protease family)
MDYKRANRSYLYMILLTIAFTILFTIYVMNTGAQISLLANNFMSECIIIIPAIAAVLYSGDRLRVMVPFKRIKPMSVLMTVLYVFLLFPLVAFVNAFSMLFVDNTVMGLSDQIMALPFWQLLLSIGIFGPFVEEFVFRGVLLQSYQRTGRIIGSIVLSSVLFGIIHMNFNQFAYGAVMGIMLALLVEATGSVLTSFIAHATFNSLEVSMMYLGGDLLEGAEDYVSGMDAKSEILMSMGVYFVAAVIATAIAFCVLVKISELEGRLLFLKSIPSCKKQGYKLITIPLIIACVIALAYMILIEVILGLLT